MSASHVAHERSKKLPEPPVMFRGRREQAPPPIPIRRRSRRPRGGGHALQPVHGPGGGEPPRVPVRNFTAAPLRASNGKSYQAVGGGRGSSPKRCRAQRRACCPPAKGSPRRCTPTSPSGLRDGAPGLAARQDGSRSSQGGVVVQEPPFSAAQTPP
ncbi:hypothetical protein NDU88_002736 [Pleurodeles waltl]|uniref:Uncharacterized protein n=1 Tax=Pleurodeles waltl TaxID=8319 RepID=A0AAV7UAL2_PLEWA|nr:hypothetical protein NDU88_002736 [Pleurodeles waltl]